MAQANGRLKNKDLNTLLVRLGFKAGETTQRFRRVWRHPEAGTIILLPANRTLDPPLEVDLVSVRTHLDYNGHLDADAFDEFVRTEKLPSVS
jgi:hypothetical protein